MKHTHSAEEDGDMHGSVCSYTQERQPVPKGCVLWDSMLHNCLNDKMAEMENRSAAAWAGSSGQTQGMLWCGWKHTVSATWLPAPGSQEGSAVLQDLAAGDKGGYRSRGLQVF